MGQTQYSLLNIMKPGILRLRNKTSKINSDKMKQNTPIQIIPSRAAKVLKTKCTTKL